MQMLIFIQIFDMHRLWKTVHFAAAAVSPRLRQRLNIEIKDRLH